MPHASGVCAASTPGDAAAKNGSCAHACPASARAAEKLEQAGYTNVYDDEEGTAGWREAQHRVASS